MRCGSDEAQGVMHGCIARGPWQRRRHKPISMAPRERDPRMHQRRPISVVPVGERPSPFLQPITSLLDGIPGQEKREIPKVRICQRSESKEPNRASSRCVKQSSSPPPKGVLSSATAHAQAPEIRWQTPLPTSGFGPVKALSSSGVEERDPGRRPGQTADESPTPSELIWLANQPQNWNAAPLR